MLVFSPLAPTDSSCFSVQAGYTSSKVPLASRKLDVGMVHLVRNCIASQQKRPKFRIIETNVLYNLLT